MIYARFIKHVKLNSNGLTNSIVFFMSKASLKRKKKLNQHNAIFHFGMPSPKFVVGIFSYSLLNQLLVAEELLKRFVEDIESQNLFSLFLTVKHDEFTILTVVLPRIAFNFAPQPTVMSVTRGDHSSAAVINYGHRSHDSVV